MVSSTFRPIWIACSARSEAGSSIIESEKQENAVLQARVQDLEHKDDRSNTEIDSLRTRMFQQADEIADGKRKEMDEKAKGFAGWMTAGLVGIGLIGVGYYAYLTGNDEDDARNMWEFWQDEVEYGITKVDAKTGDPDKTVPDHRFGGKCSKIISSVISITTW